MAKLLNLLTNTYVYYEETAQGIKLEVLSEIRKTLGLSWSEMGRLIDEEVRAEKKSQKQKVD